MNDMYFATKFFGEADHETDGFILPGGRPGREIVGIRPRVARRGRRAGQFAMDKEGDLRAGDSGHGPPEIGFGAVRKIVDAGMDEKRLNSKNSLVDERLETVAILRDEAAVETAIDRKLPLGGG